MIESIVKSIVIDVVMKAVLARIVMAIPFLGMPIIGPIFGFLLGKVFTLVAEELTKMVENKVIDIKVGGQKDKYDEAVNNLKVVVESPDKTPEQIEAAKNEFKKRLQDLISLNS